MPEGPEVETVKRLLLSQILNKQITDINVLYEPIVEGYDERWKTRVIGQKIIDVRRIGKYLIFELEKNMLIVHLRMEGKFYLEDTDQLPSKHIHVSFELDHKKVLNYHDTRKFGRFYLRSKENYLIEKPLKELAKEPEDTDPKAFYLTLKKRKQAIKTVLLNQHLLLSLGNIYVDETLFKAKIHPLREASSLTKKDVSNILKSADETLKKAIQLGGTTIRTFEVGHGITGLFQNELLIHMKKGMPCPVCQTPIVKMVVGGRGTYVCPKCQQ